MNNLFANIILKPKIIFLILFIISAYSTRSENIKIGAIRWDGWAGSSSWIGREAERTLSPQRYHYRVPFFGVEVDTGKVLINGNSQEIVDQELIYANYAGLDYWAFVWHYPNEWGWDYGQNLYKSSKYKKLVDYCWIMQPSYFINLISIDQIVNDFKDPSYVKVMGNRPLMYFFFGYYNDINPNNIDELRRKTVEAGLGTPYLVLMNEYGNFNILDSLHLDAMSDYAHWQFNGAPYSSLTYMDWYYWRYKGVEKNQKLIPTVTAGWDKRCNYDAKTEWDYKEEYKNYWVEMPTPEELANHIKLAIDWSAGWYDVVESKSIIIYAWNEHSEGGFLCPTLKNYGGTSRIEAIRKKLGLGDFIKINNYTRELFPCYNDKSSFIECEAINPDSLPFEYIWYKEDIEIAKTKINRLYFEKADSSINGFYKCKVVINGLPDNAVTQGIFVKVVDPLIITSQAKSISAIINDSVNFEINAKFDGKDLISLLGSNKAQIRWYKLIGNNDSLLLVDDGKNIIGSKSSKLKILNIRKEDFGKYFAIISTTCDVKKSEIVELKEFNIEFNISKQSKDIIICRGENALLNIEANSNTLRKINYQWFKDSIKINDINLKISGANTNSLKIFNLDEKDIGKYSCKVNLDRTFSEKSSDLILLTLKYKPQIIFQPRELKITEGDSLKIEIKLKSNSDSLNKYVWLKDNKVINNDNPFYFKPKANLSDSGIYKCEITNSCGKISSENISVKIFLSTDIKNNSSFENISISPNPASDYIEISYSPSIKRGLGGVSFEIFNIFGESVSTTPPFGHPFELEGEKMKIDVSNLPAGVYFIRIGDKFENFVKI